MSSLKVRTARGAVWMIASNVATRLIGLVGTLVLTRYLVPEAYGEVSAASIWLLTASQISTVGVGMYIIARPDAGRDLAFHATILHLGLGALVIAGFAFGQQWLGGLIDSAHVSAFIPGLMISVLLDRIRFMPERILVRDMRFGTISTLRGGGELVYTAVSLLCAIGGLGAMSIVWGNIARALARTLIVLCAADWRDWIQPCRVQISKFRELLAYGMPLWFVSLAAYGSRNWDNLLVGHFFGAASMGRYQLAYNLADIPAVQIGEQIGDVLLPSFAHMEHRQRVPALIRSTSLVGMIIFPMAIGLGTVAPTAVRALLSDSWAGVTPMLIILSALSVTRPLGWTIGAYLSVVARERTSVMVLLEFIKIVVLLGAIALTGSLGPLWACAAVGVAFAIHAICCMLAARHFGGVPMRAFLGGLAPSLAACVPMVLAILCIRLALQHAGFEHALAAFVLEVMAGSLAYVAATFAIARHNATEFIGLLNHALGRR